MHKPSRVDVAGPLAAYAIGFRRELAGRGYSRSRATGLLLLMARLSVVADRAWPRGQGTVRCGYRALRFLPTFSQSR
jgi:hypothetical protein